TWSRQMKAQDPEYFSRLAMQQTPRYLWIGCSDSRVPANEIIGLPPGEVFVHRNIANLVIHTDLNCLSVIQYAIDVLRVSHVMVVGHYGCGGIQAVLEGRSIGLADHWLDNVDDVRQVHARRLNALRSNAERADRMCELNVIEQVFQVTRLHSVRTAWGRLQRLSVHGFIYGVHDGILRTLGSKITGTVDPAAWRRQALRALWMNPSPRLASESPLNLTT
ncbi:MAG: carbonic anhydrase, partial [Rhodocyclaceae bacterium]|nr:carbonic anhydrase [Rhodocyclaceae bacterium]